MISVGYISHHIPSYPAPVCFSQNAWFALKTIFLLKVLKNPLVKTPRNPILPALEKSAMDPPWTKDVAPSSGNSSGGNGTVVPRRAEEVAISAAAIRPQRRLEHVGTIGMTDPPTD